MTEATRAGGLGWSLLALLAFGATGLVPPARAGAPGDRRACVTSNGTLVLTKSKGVVSVVKNAGLGDYTVQFNKPVDRCGKVATLGFCSAVPPRPGEIAVADDVR